MTEETVRAWRPLFLWFANGWLLTLAYDGWLRGCHGYLHLLACVWERIRSLLR